MSDAQATPATEPEDKVVAKLKLDMPQHAKGAAIQIAGLGTFENGATHDITESQHEQFRVQSSTYEDVVNDNNELVGVKPILGSTLAEAFKDNEDVTVTSSKKGGSSS